jgi:hypothetical protein
MPNYVTKDLYKMSYLFQNVKKPVRGGVHRLLRVMRKNIMYKNRDHACTSMYMYSTGSSLFSWEYEQSATATS